MLPDGFTWEGRGDGYRLRVGEQEIASMYPNANGTWRVALNPNRAERRFQFLPNATAARAYVEAWARKWEDRLRDCYRGRTS